MKMTRKLGIVTALPRSILSWVLLPSLLVAFPSMVQAQTIQDWVLTTAKPDNPGMSESVPDQSTLRSLGGGQPSIAEFSDGQTLVVFAHQDDDLLWMMPFWPVTSKFLLAGYPAAPIFEDLTTSLPPQLNYHVRWTPIWGTVDNDIWADIFTDRCKRAPIVNLATLKSHLRPYLTSSIKRIITHNNWGEYGHAQHRLVNMAVRQLAVEKGVDVWALGTRMPLEAHEQSQYVNVAGDLGLPTIEGYFDPNLFRDVRGHVSGSHTCRFDAGTHGQVSKLVGDAVDLVRSARSLPDGMAPLRQARRQGRRPDDQELRSEAT